MRALFDAHMHIQHLNRNLARPRRSILQKLTKALRLESRHNASFIDEQSLAHTNIATAMSRNETSRRQRELRKVLRQWAARAAQKEAEQHAARRSGNGG
jgi:hypothetical protein